MNQVFVRFCMVGVALAFLSGCANARLDDASSDSPFNIAGVYPHLAMYNSQGECGTGAVVPWAGRLWVVTYAPHYPIGSDDKLYEITPELEQIIRPESVGGTPANRMIHRESNQLVIANYFIDADRNVRAIPPRTMPGRPTGTARHLTDPAGKVYIATMEEGLYEIDVETLGVTCLINDGNINPGATAYPDAISSRLLGYHGKGLYSGQGGLFYSNNGEHGQDAKRDPTTASGALAQWGGPGKDWQLILREQFTEITGPGGIYGAPEVPEGEEDTAPIWAMGWDHRSVILRLLDKGEWHQYRMPKASFSYDGAHGWNTEWPRIREIGEGDDFLATMHGTFWHFPRTFSLRDTSGIAPRSNYLKVIGDFARWGDFIVLGCDDSAKSEFLNKRPFKSEGGASMVSNSNLWFVTPEQLSECGPALGSGGPWYQQDIPADESSDPYLFAGYDHRMLHLGHAGETAATFIVEVDRKGNGQWEELVSIEVPAKGYVSRSFDGDEAGEWVRIRPTSAATGVTAWFHYADEDTRTTEPAAIFDGIATADSGDTLGGVMRGLGNGHRTLGLIAQNRLNQDRQMYQLDAALGFEPVALENETLRAPVRNAAQPIDIPIQIDGASVIVEEDGKRWRLPIAPSYAEHQSYGTVLGPARVVREVATERDMLNVGGTFYELPARNAGGFQHVRPIASHPFTIHDFCSYRGLMLITGIDRDADGPRIFKSPAGDSAVWAGAVDEFWQMGKPVGVGGPWHDSAVQAGTPSDPYLMYGYDRKSLELAADQPAKITIQIDPTGTGTWFDYATLAVTPDQPAMHAFPAGFSAHWLRFVSDVSVQATATLTYE